MKITVLLLLVAVRCLAISVPNEHTSDLNALLMSEIEKVLWPRESVGGDRVEFSKRITSTFPRGTSYAAVMAKLSAAIVGYHPDSRCTLSLVFSEGLITVYAECDASEDSIKRLRVTLEFSANALTDANETFTLGPNPVPLEVRRAQAERKRTRR